MFSQKIPRRGVLDWVRIAWLFVATMAVLLLGTVGSATLIREGPIIAWPLVIGILVFWLAATLRVAAAGVYGDDKYLYIVQLHKTECVPWESVTSVHLVPVPLLHRIDPTEPDMVAIQTQDGKRIRIFSMIGHVWPVLTRPKGPEFMRELKAEVQAHGGKV